MVFLSRRYIESLIIHEFIVRGLDYSGDSVGGILCLSVEPLNRGDLGSTRYFSRILNLQYLMSK